MSDYSAEVAPKHLNKIQLGAVGRQLEQQYQTTSCCSEHLVYFSALVSICIIYAAPRKQDCKLRCKA